MQYFGEPAGKSILKEKLYKDYTKMCSRSYYNLEEHTEGAFFWDYSIDSYSGIRITTYRISILKRTDFVLF